MIGVTEDDLRAEFVQFKRRDRFHRALRAHRHKERRLHHPAAGLQQTRPGFGSRIGGEKGERVWAHNFATGFLIGDSSGIFGCLRIGRKGAQRPQKKMVTGPLLVTFMEKSYLKEQDHVNWPAPSPPALRRARVLAPEISREPSHPSVASLAVASPPLPAWGQILVFCFKEESPAAGAGPSWASSRSGLPIGNFSLRTI